MRLVLAMFAMLAAAGLAIAMKPTRDLTHDLPAVDLEAIVPKRFADWQVDEAQAPLIVSPDVKAQLERLYSQTLTRTYISSNGERVMLSIAYSGRHGEEMQTHRPEICYPAQGFTISKESTSVSLQTRYGPLRVTRLVAVAGARHEPITYWVVVGGNQTQFGLHMKLAQIRYTLTGRVPDGLLLRVSSIDRDSERASGVHMEFFEKLLAATDPKDRWWLIGHTQI